MVGGSPELLIRSQLSETTELIKHNLSKEIDSG